MKVKELPVGTKLETVKIRIPPKHRQAAYASVLDSMEVYLTSSWLQGIWVKTSLENGRVYPITGILASEVLKWEVV